MSGGRAAVRELNGGDKLRLLVEGMGKWGCIEGWMREGKSGEKRYGPRQYLVLGQQGPRCPRSRSPGRPRATDSWCRLVFCLLNLEG